MAARDTAWVGIDLGTQSVKVVAVSNTGDTLCRHTQPLTSIRDSRLHEQSPQQWLDATVHCLREVTQALPDGFDVAGLSTSATSGTIAVANHETGLLRPTAIMYDDTRGHEFTSVAQHAGEATWSRLGYTLQDSWALPAMLWWNSVEPLADSEVFITQADVIHWFLAGARVASDSSHTLKAGFDLDNRRWPRDVFDTLDLPEHVLNDVVTPGTRIGVVGPAAAHETGLPEGTPIVAGMTDGSAAQIAAGAVSPGQWNSVLGTTLVLKGSSTSRRFDSTGAIYCHLAPFDSGWWPGGASNTGTRALHDLVSPESLNDVVFSREMIHDTPVHYPLTGVGERFPFVHADATGFVVDDSGPPISNDSHRLFAAIALGVALVERLAFDVMSAAGYSVDGPISLTGGASQNHQWNQLRSTVMNRACVVPRDADGAVGMGILARAGTGGSSAKDFATIVATMVTPDTIISPDHKLRTVVDRKYSILLDHLEARGWISADTARFARENIR